MTNAKMTTLEMHDVVLEIQTALGDLSLRLADVRNELGRRVVRERKAERRTR